MPLDGTHFTAVVGAIGGSWGLANIILTATVALNDRRDAIVTGRLKEVKLTPLHRRHMAEADWLPMAVGITVALVGVILVAAGLLPKMFDVQKETEGWVWPAAIFACLIVASIGTVQIVKEFQFMVSSIDNAPNGLLIEKKRIAPFRKD